MKKFLVEVQNSLLVYFLQVALFVINFNILSIYVYMLQVARQK